MFFMYSIKAKKNCYNYYGGGDKADANEFSRLFVHEFLSGVVKSTVWVVWDNESRTRADSAMSRA